jgi:hypothetical protein
MLTGGIRSALRFPRVAHFWLGKYSVLKYPLSHWKRRRSAQRDQVAVLVRTRRLFRSARRGPPLWCIVMRKDRQSLSELHLGTAHVQPQPAALDCELEAGAIFGRVARGERRRTSCGSFVLFFGTAHHDLQRVIRQRPLQRLRLIARRAPSKHRALRRSSGQLSAVMLSLSHRGESLIHKTAIFVSENLP